MSAKRKRSDSNPSPSLADLRSVHPVYQKLLPQAPNGVAFLFSDRFTNTLKGIASKASDDYSVTAECALEEFRRLLAIKAFMSDHEAEKSMSFFCSYTSK
jgi:hypothetical protein